MSNTHTRPSTRYIEVEGPATEAAKSLADRNLVIVSISGSNGCDFENETAESYIVEVATDNHTLPVITNAKNLEQLTGYHAGDHDQFVAELRVQAKIALRDYAEAAAGKNASWAKKPVRDALAAAVDNLDSALEEVAK